MNRKKRILIADDDEVGREILKEALLKENFEVVDVSSGEEALERCKSEKFHLIITDVKMGGMSGIELIKKCREYKPTQLFLVITAFGESHVTIEAIKEGAFDILIKPFSMEKIRQKVRNALEKKEIIDHSQNVSVPDMAMGYTRRLIGKSEAMHEVFKLIGRVANSNTPVLIQGESGTGKELVARSIHENSYRRNWPFLAINCGAIPENLLESELFGYEKGAFTGAEKPKMGILEAANGGTCFLDEIGEMPLNMQTKLLRFLQEGEIMRLGATKSFKVDVRIISATNKDLEKMVKENKFREDLYYRLNVVQINLPPLRERREDIPLLVDFFLKNYSLKNKIPPKKITKEVLNIFMNYDWPGNVRELENVVESAATLSPTNIIDVEHIPEKIRKNGEIIKRDNTKEIILAIPEENFPPLYEVEKMYILKVLKAVKNNKSKAARILGIDRKTLRLKLKQYGIEDKEE